jgi:hypothetical protein
MPKLLSTGVKTRAGAERKATTKVAPVRFDFKKGRLTDDTSQSERKFQRYQFSSLIHDQWTTFVCSLESRS